MLIRCGECGGVKRFCGPSGLCGNKDQGGDLVGGGVVFHMLKMLLFVRSTVFLLYTTISLYCNRRSCRCFLCAVLLGALINKILLVYDENTRGQLAQQSKCYVMAFA